MREEISTLRQYNQKLTSKKFTNPEEVVTWFGAVQSQDFAAAKWALALRSRDQTDATIEKAFNEGEILRTHIMRPTWHFVTPQDIRWILALTTERVQRFNGHYYRKSGLSKSIFEKSNEVIKETLQGGKKLTRTQLNEALQKANIPTQDLGLTYTLMQAELEGIIVSGPRIGKQFTYMLLEERAPKTHEITREEALAELTKRYFQSHGPAQIQDFSWWSGLTLAEVKHGIELQKDKLIKEEKDGKTYWFFPLEKDIKPTSKAFLIPGFDEYFIAYKDRSEILKTNYAKELNQGGGMINGAIIVNGKMIGGWKRILGKKTVVITIKLFEKISEEQEQSIHEQAQQYGDFHNLPVTIKKSLH